jgi:transcriptional regulator with XRE-family HTH domain
MVQTKPRDADVIDKHVGERLMQMRREMGVSQADVGLAVGVSYQQIQKYERGFNRISVSRLWKICEYLDVTPSYFFEGCEDRTQSHS